jgi:NAD(P)-dependent dehydrogenase (short-subunit alcohol dehydrogenase family)
METSLFDLTGKKALITGSSQGIGFGIARGLGQAGATIILNGRDEEKLNRALLEDQKFDAMVRSRTPAGRWGEPSDLAGAAIFLASRASDYITGQIIYVEGGLLSAL